MEESGAEMEENDSNLNILIEKFIYLRPVVNWEICPAHEAKTAADADQVESC